MDNQHIVLFSGGWESVLCAASAPASAQLCFAQYQQPYLGQESRAVFRLAQVLERELITITLPPMDHAAGIFPDRNAHLLRAAREYGGHLWYGCRAPLAIFDRYGDSNRQFATRMEAELGAVIHTPCILLPKWVVRSRAAKHIAERMVYSSEGYHYGD